MTMDFVTGLAPRSDLHARLDGLAASGVPVALVICDIVGLKGLNEREGFLAGDAELRRAADRLRAAAAAADLVARLGGDELVAVFTGTDALSAAERAARDLGADGRPELRSAAVSARPGEPCGPLIERLYATMRRS